MNSQSPGILKDLEEKVKKKNIQLWQLEQTRFFFVWWFLVWFLKTRNGLVTINNESALVKYRFAGTIWNLLRQMITT